MNILSKITLLAIILFLDSFIGIECLISMLSLPVLIQI